MSFPLRQGLYDPQFERDACGVGLVATLRGEPTHRVIEQGLEVLRNLAHRGAAGRDPETGDGAGVLLQIPHALFAAIAARDGLELPGPGDYGVAMCFLPQQPAKRRACEAALEAAAEARGMRVVGWRDVPVDPAALGNLARRSLPAIRQLFLARAGVAPSAFDRALHDARAAAEASPPAEGFYVASCSSVTVVYKGLLLAGQLAAFYPELADPRTASRIALVHSRFSTNTFPSWELAHPFRRLAHNGEINTLRGNRVWARARGAELEGGGPTARPGASDSSSLDEMVDFLVARGRTLPHAVMMLVPEAWEHEPTTEPAVRAFYDYHARLAEPWDGPAAIVFSDGRIAGAVLDRNGLRPAKYVVTSSGLVVLASEFGVLPLNPADIVEKGRLRPGTALLIDTERGCLVRDEQVKREAASRAPYGAWLEAHSVTLSSLPSASTAPMLEGVALGVAQRAFGYTREDLGVVLTPMAGGAEEAVGSMGVDTPLAVLSDLPQLIFRYFKQQFAQVTNPPIDPVREAVVMSLAGYLGGEGSLGEETPELARRIELPSPVLFPGDLARIAQARLGGSRAEPLATLFDALAASPTEALRDALEQLAANAVAAVRGGARVLVLSDREACSERAAIPSLLALGATHHALLRAGVRARTSLVVEAGDAREVAHVALLLGYGASAVCPYVALDTVAELARSGGLGTDRDPTAARARFAKALCKGLLKVMSKMGISTLTSYRGAQHFEALGLDQAIVDRYFAGTPSRLRGVGLADIARDALAFHALAYDDAPTRLVDGGYYRYRAGGEVHLWSPGSVAALQKAVRTNDPQSYARYASLINDQRERPATLRGLFELRPARAPIPVDAVESASAILSRFATGAMSYGSLSKEAHENLAIAMNRIGARSNSGEGGEDDARARPSDDGDSRRSAIKQVASARFGVTTSYLVSADELQIKVAQGAKPGEGGQLPGHKVDGVIARLRHATSGVTLISPPPHHDIYSIEDLAQLIFDLKSVNPRAHVSVKLVAEAGVGAVAAGVAKADADAILISGHDGGTGASPLSSIHNAGVPWELGLAEAHQVLVLNGLRNRVRLQVDGQLKTGRDVVVGALLGAQEFGFATAPLVASGCVMTRKCHLNTCPVGVATQDPVLRARFPGTPEHVIAYFAFVANEVRTLLASLGFASLDEAVGRADCIVPRREGLSPKARRLDFSEVLYRPSAPAESSPHGREPSASAEHFDASLLSAAAPALDARRPVRLRREARNRDRAIGTMLSGEVARRFGAAGLPDDTIRIDLEGNAGQSLGAFLARGVTLRLEGDTNDYAGKGLSGGVLAVCTPRSASYRAEENVIAGNTVLYGATSGRAFFQGRAGERFAVRNSGARAVVEGVGDHGCEYMTGGVVVVLGETGRNFGAGMSGGVAFVLGSAERFRARCHPDARADVDGTLDESERALVHALLTEHLVRTGSAVAAALLGAWPRAASRFAKLLPAEYRRALEAQRIVALTSLPTLAHVEAAHG